MQLMSMIRTKATVDSDGMVHLDVPVGKEHVGREVEVTVETTTANNQRERSLSEHAARVEELAGCIDDPTFDPDANRSMTATGIQYPAGYQRLSREEWKTFVEETAGSIDDPTFVEPPDPPPQSRGPLFR